MLPWKAGRIGDHIRDVQTPALVLERGHFERNMDRLMQSVGALRVRPHAKSHKCPEIARQQIARGAVGICCQKLSEAAVFAAEGIENILVTNQVVGAQKCQTAAQLAQRIQLGVLVDDRLQIEQLAHAMKQLPAPNPRCMDIYVEVEVGGARCGAMPGAVLALVTLIRHHPTLRFAGLHCYNGAAQHKRTPSERQSAVDQVAFIAEQTIGLLKRAGIEVPCITGGGTGTFAMDCARGVMTEVQPGSYIFMDADYRRNELWLKDPVFDQALFVLTSVISRSHEGFVVVDAGLKASSVDSGLPEVWRNPDLLYKQASDEHGVVQARSGQSPRLGATLKLIPGHCDPTVNLYDDLLVIDKDHVVDVWPIAARGACL
jgi:D-serine deaminase-like pyridoxal phosphate-dependent protein